MIPIALSIGDQRVGERRLACPLSQVFFVCVNALMGPVAASPWWGGLLAWYTGLGIVF